MRRKNEARTSFQIDKATNVLLGETRDILGCSSKASTIRTVVMIARREGLIPFAVPKLVFADTRPVIITGEPGSGKTTIIRKLLASRSFPVLLIDVNNEYIEGDLPNGGYFKGLKKIGEGDIFSIKWARPGRFRFVPNPNVEVSKAQVEMIIGHLNRIKLQGFDPKIVPSGILKDWVFIIEESQRFLKSPNFGPFIIEARKVTRKVIIVCTDWKPLEGLAEVMKPPPRD